MDFIKAIEDSQKLTIEQKLFVKNKLCEKWGYNDVNFDNKEIPSLISEKLFINRKILKYLKKEIDTQIAIEARQNIILTDTSFLNEE